MREKETEYESEHVCVCVFVRERERERENVRTHFIVAMSAMQVHESLPLFCLELLHQEVTQKCLSFQKISAETCLDG